MNASCSTVVEAGARTYVLSPDATMWDATVPSARTSRHLRVLHLATVPFRPEEGVSRAVTALATHMTSIQSHLAADAPVGDGFAGLHGLPGWKPRTLVFGRALADVVAGAQPDIVHLHGGILAASLAYVPALRRLPIVATVYQLLPVPRHEMGWGRLADAHRSSLRPSRMLASGVAGLPLARRLLKTGRLRAVCTPDPRVAAALDDHGAVFIARGGADPSSVRAAWSDSPTIVFAGRAERGRGVEELVSAFSLLRLKVPNAKLRLLLLPGPEGERWRHHWATRPGLELHLGVEKDLLVRFSECQVVALPFRIPATITPPLVAAEAMSAGLPVVSTGLSCLTPLVTSGHNGMIAADLSPEALAAALFGVVGDRATWERLSAGARRTIEEDWSWVGAAAATQHAYEYAIKGHAAPPWTT